MWAALADSQGNRKTRPAVVISQPEALTPDEPIVVLAITTTFPDPPLVTQVPVPWSARTRTTTGLRRRSAVVCNWECVLNRAEIVSVEGFLPAEYLRRVLEVRQQLPRRSE